MEVQTELIQPGWMVVSSDGQELGPVTRIDATSIHVKKGGMLGGELTFPRSSVTEVETGRVEISMTKSEAESNRA